MSIARAFHAELTREAATTRKMLERLPEDRLDFRPHPRSMTLGRLAGHVAEIPGWGERSVSVDELDLAPPGGPQYKAATAESREQVLAVFDQCVKASLDALANVPDDSHWMKPWRLLRGGHKLLEMPRIAVMRNFCMNHLIHHRGQLSVYLRLNDVPVPSIYGPSADEGQLG